MPNTLPGDVPDQLPSLELQVVRESWYLLFQGGAWLYLDCGSSLFDSLVDQAGIPQDELQRVEAWFLDGSPVDEPRTTALGVGARLALASGLPGIAGLAMNSNSAVRALRGGISHPGTTVAAFAAGWVSVRLYALSLSRLAPLFLYRGVTISLLSLARYGGRAEADACCLNGEPCTVAQAVQSLQAGSFPFVRLRFAEVMSHMT